MFWPTCLPTFNRCLAQPKFRQYLASFTCMLSFTMTGITFVWLNPLMLWLVSPESEIPMTKSDTSWIVAAIQFGALISPIPTGLLADRIGRKQVLLSTGPLCICSWLIVLTTRSIPALYVIRILQGFATGVVFTAGPAYIAEIASPEIRGELCGHLQTMWYFGNLLAYIIGPYMSYQNYALACSVVPILFVFTFSFMPESPYYLLMKNDNESAEESLKWLRGNSGVLEELKTIRESVNEDLNNQGSWKSLVATKANRRSLFIVQLVCFVKYFSGMPAVVTYSTQTFKESSGDELDENQLTILVGVVLFGATFIAAYCADSVGRKPLLVLSAMGSAIFSGIIGLYYFIDRKTAVDVSGQSWLMEVSVACYCIINSIGLGPLMETIQAEYFPSNTRSLGGGLTSMIGSVASFVVMKQYQWISDVAGTYLNFLIYSISALTGTILISIFMQETAKRSLGQIQSDIKRRTSKVDVLEPS